MHESSLHERSSFVTLTYDEEHMPADEGLHLEDFQRFMRKLRKYTRNQDRRDGVEVRKIRFFHCGEYGDRKGRPHYHAAIFGEDFRRDAVPVRGSRRSDLWTSGLLQRAWPAGLCVAGSLTFESAAYVASYTTKKAFGSKAHAQYVKVDVDTGEFWQVAQEYATMSRRPGLGAGWFEKWHTDVYPSDSVLSRGRLVKPPRFYDLLMERREPQTMEWVRQQRMLDDPSEREQNRPSRLADRDQVIKGSRRWTREPGSD